jgi:hyaluronate lyase
MSLERTVSAFRPVARLGAGLLGVLIMLLATMAWADSFDDLRLEWRDFMTGGTNLNLADPVVASRVSSIASTANNRWSTLNKAANRTYLWSDAASTTVSADIVTTYQRLRDMALGWATLGSSVYSNASLAADIVAGLDWAYTNRYNENSTLYDNWWSWEIGAPAALNDCMVLMYPVLTGTQITNYCKAIDKFTPNVSPSYFGWLMTGANRIWKAEIVAVRGVVGRNSAKIAAARDGLSDAAGGGAASIFKYVTSGDGFYADGSFIQHDRHPYTAGYGLYLFRDAAPMLVWLDGSPWAVTDPQRTNVVNWAFNSFEPFLYRGALVEHLRGREISRNYTGFSVGRSAITTMLRLAQTAPPADAARLKSLVKYMDATDTTAGLTDYVDLDLITAAKQLLADTNVVSRGELAGHFQFPAMDRVMHLRPGFGLSISMSSARIYNFESINNENYKGWFTGDGMTYLLNGDLTQFTDGFWPTVDPYRLPGTTVDLTPRANSSGADYLSPESWVGGAVLSNRLGAAGMSLNAYGSSLVAKKSWFMFDDEIVCLGAGITGGSSNVITTIENRRLASSSLPFTADGVAMPTTLGWSSNFASLTWCALSNAGGYYFPGGVSVKAQRVARTGSWADINADGSTSGLTRHYLNLWFDHGVAPANASYAYVLLPNLTNVQVAAYAANPQVQIVENSSQAQAVRETALGVLAVNFWNAAPKTVDFITCSNQASVVVQETPDDLTVAVSDPTQNNTGVVSLVLNRSALSVAALDAGVTVLQTSPTIRLTVNMNNRRGQTATARFITYTNTPPTLAPLPDREIVADTPLVITNSAADVGSNPQSLAYSLAAAPAGAVIDPVSGVIQWTPGTNAVGLSHQFKVVVTENGWVTNLPAQADAYVRNGTPTANFGAATTLEVRLGSSTTTRETYLRFGLPTLRGTIRDATLELTPTETFTPVTHAVAAATSDDWDELTLNWNNRPGSGVMLATWMPQTGVAGAAEVGLAARAVTNGWLSLRVFATNDAGGPVTYVSREGAAAQAPRLRVVTTNGPLLSATQSFWVKVYGPPLLAAVSNQTAVVGTNWTQTNAAFDPNVPPQQLWFSLAASPSNAVINPTNGLITWTPLAAQAGTSHVFSVVVAQAGWLTNLPPVADAYVRNGTPTGNYGSNTVMEVKLGSASTTREAYLRFGLAGLPGQVALAQLQLQALTTFSPGVHAVALVTNDAWAEYAVNWNTRPDAGLAPVTTWTPVAGEVTSVEVGALTAAEAAGDGWLSLRVFATNATADGLVEYAAREAASGDTPALRVWTTNTFALSTTQSFLVYVPALPSSAPTLQVVGNATNPAVLQVGATVGANCQIQASTNLLDWETVFTTNASAPLFEWSDPAASQWPRRFYRALIQP